MHSEKTYREIPLLALIARQQPVTAYQLFKIHEQSAAGSINSSKGTVYPAIARLKARGLATAKAVRGDRRKSEDLYVTDLGIAAVKDWAKAIDVSLVIIDDPLRARILSFDLLTREERMEWVARAKEAVKIMASRVEDYPSIQAPFQELMHKNANELLRAKMQWLDEVLYEVAAQGMDKTGP